MANTKDGKAAAPEAISVAFGWLSLVLPALYLSAIQPTMLLAFSALVLSVGLLALPLLLIRTWGRYFSLMALPTILGYCFAAFVFSYGEPPMFEAYVVIKTATWEDIRGFLALHLSLPVSCALLAVLLAYAVTCRHTWSKPVRVTNPRRFGLLVAAPVLLALPAGADNRPAGSAFARGVSDNYVEVLSSTTHPLGTLTSMAVNLPAELAATTVRKTPYGVVSTASQTRIVVFMIGESARYDGFHAPDGRLRDDELVRHGVLSVSHAATAANMTINAVPILMTGKRPREYVAGSIHGSLVDLFAEAGYRTAWLVNQDLSISKRLAIEADRFFYPFDAKENTFGRSLPDGALLPKLASLLSDAPDDRGLFIGLHTSGSHWEYYKRYPDAFERNRSKELNRRLSFFSRSGQAHTAMRLAYDDSIRYTQWMIRQVVAELRQLQRPALFVYVPDHGENFMATDQQRGHGGAVAVAGEVHVPVLLWASDAWKAENVERWAQLEQNLGARFTTDGVFHTISDLAGLEFPELDRHRSLASPAYRVPANAVIKTLTGFQPIDDCPACFGDGRALRSADRVL